MPIPKTSLFIRSLTDTMNAANFAKDFMARTRGSIKGIITDVLDPLNEGRVKVVIDSKNGETQFQSDWIPVAEPFVGKLPESLIGSRVSINPTDSDMQRMVVNAVINDEESEEVPVNTTMTRMPVYQGGKLPPPCKENCGCVVLEENGEFGWDWLNVCLGRTNENGEREFYWVRMSHHNHQHYGTMEDEEMELIIKDSVNPTTNQENYLNSNTKWLNPPESENL